MGMIIKGVHLQIARTQMKCHKSGVSSWSALTLFATLDTLG